jgi:hypothetical protein
MKNATPTPDLTAATTQPSDVAIRQPSSLDILDAAVRGGVTSENVAVVKEIIAMRREELAHQNKIDFNRSFFELKQEIRTMNFYADKEAKNNSGKVAYTYCSEREILSGLETVLFKHGFDMLFSQRADDGKITAVVTLIHNKGHEVSSEFTVRAGASNAMKDATACDTGAATSALRHLLIKMFGLKSRICESDARNLGDLAKKITKEQADELEHRLKMVNHNPAKILSYVGATSIADIPAAMFGVADRMIEAIDNPRK